MDMFTRKKPAVKLRCVSLDLSVMPPSPGRLLELLDVAKEARFNCFAVSWGDCYPWKFYPGLRSEQSYSDEDVKRFMDKARSLSIEVIPLIHSFGHLEFLLSKKRFAGLREQENDASSLCPLKKESLDVIKKMIGDIMRTHEGYISRFHIGADEVWNLGSCPACRKEVRENGRAALFLSHILPLAQFLSQQGLGCIIWDDMCRKWPVRDLKRIEGRLDLAVWAYKEASVKRIASSGIIEKYINSGIRVWGCPAFKGGDRADADNPDTAERIKNVMAWVNEDRKHGLAGIIATGWGRYNFFRIPCEGIESSLDSLVLAGACLWNGRAVGPETAMRFLNRGKMRRLAGTRFLKCREASERSAAWRNKVSLLAGRICTYDVVAGEKKRMNPAALTTEISSIDSLLEEGRKVFCAWVDAHSGLAPKRLLEQYADSRFVPAKKILTFLKAELRKSLKNAG